MTESVFLRFLGTGSTNWDAVFTVKLVILGTDFPYWTLWVDSVNLKQQVQKSSFTEIPKTIYSHTIKIGVNMIKKILQYMSDERLWIFCWRIIILRLMGSQLAFFKNLLMILGKYWPRFLIFFTVWSPSYPASY